MIAKLAHVQSKLQLLEQQLKNNDYRDSVNRLKGDQASFIGEIGWNKADIRKANSLIQEQTKKISELDNTFASRTTHCLNHQIQLHTSYDDLADFEEAIDDLSDRHTDLAKSHNELRLSTNLRLNRLSNKHKGNKLLLSSLQSQQQATRDLLSNMASTIEFLVESHDRSDRNLARALVRIRAIERNNALISDKLLKLLP